MPYRICVISSSAGQYFGVGGYINGVASPILDRIFLLIIDICRSDAAEAFVKENATNVGTPETKEGWDIYSLCHWMRVLNHALLPLSLRFAWVYHARSIGGIWWELGHEEVCWHLRWDPLISSWSEFIWSYGTVPSQIYPRFIIRRIKICVHWSCPCWGNWIWPAAVKVDRMKDGCVNYSSVVGGYISTTCIL